MSQAAVIPRRLEMNAVIQGTTKSVLCFGTHCYHGSTSCLDNHHVHSIHQLGKTIDSDMSSDDTGRTKAIKKVFCLHHRSNPTA